MSERTDAVICDCSTTSHLGLIRECSHYAFRISQHRDAIEITAVRKVTYEMKRWHL
jgi:hypothetical protein